MLKRPVFKRDLLILTVYLSTMARGQYEPYGENVALKKPATQSSTYTENGFSYNASLGVDGNTSTNFNDKTCSHTGNNQQSAWWTVNLNGLFFIKFIRIYQLIKQSTHSDPGYNRLNGAKMYARMEGNTWQQIYFDSNSPPNSFDVNVTLDKLISSITLNTTELTPQTREAFISICEFQAYIVLTCSPYTIQNGSFSILKLGDSRQNFTYGAKLNVTCKEGYHISENGASVTEAEKTIECMANKTWSGNFKCSVTDCGHPPRLPDHSKVTITPGIAGNTTYNATLTIQCNEGYNYSLQAVEPLRCSSNGSWKGSLGYCKVIDCGWPVDIPGNSTITSASGIDGNTSYNSTIRVRCNEGFISTTPGYETVRCDNDGNWSSVFGTCEVVQCDLLDGLPGDSTFTSHFGLAGNMSYNATVTIKCNEGFSYTRPGKETIRCNSNGKWSAILGICEANPDRSGPNLAGAAGGGSAAGICVIIAISVAVVCVRRRNGRRDENSSDKVFDEVQRSSERRNEEEEININSSKDNAIYAQPMKRKDRIDKVDPVVKNEDLIKANTATEYYSYLPQNVTTKHTIRLEDLSSFFLSRKLEPELYEVEFRNLPQGLTKPHDTSLLPENRMKNRYKHIHPYDDTRVHLEISDPETESDYINASFVNGFKTFHAYIASQGPTKDIINDFWRMIWQTNCSKIVMLTNLTEDGKHKCEQYWPDEDSIEFGDITVRLMQCETFSDFKIRTLELKKEIHQKGKRKTEPRRVKHFHFTAWPDKGVPKYASSLVHFRHKVCKTNVRGATNGPLVVHCSAGIGRTGTFLALDYLVDQAEELGYINVVNCVESLRKQRVNLVQTIEQYVFLHEAIVEALTCTTSALSSNEFQEAYRKLIEPDVETGKRRLDIEFEKLRMYVEDAKDDVYEDARSIDNQKKNRYSNILPDKNYCPILSVYVKGSGSYINAVFLPAYKENNSFIVTQTPLESTKVDFWRMVYQFEVNSIVMLNNLSQMKLEERYWPDDDDVLKIPPFTIILESKLADNISTRYTFSLRYHDDCRKIRLSRSMYWADGESVPKSPSSMLKQIDLIQGWQQETGNKPIIVHCMSGTERSGLFCLVAALIERTKIEQDVAVEQIIKQMRSRRPQIIPNVDQFKFCYDAIKTYLELYDTYSNFTGL